MIRILHVLDTLDICAGMTSVVMNYHRKIDRNRVQFDYLFFVESQFNYNSEIEALGGRIYKISKPSLSKSFREQANAFLLFMVENMLQSIVILFGLLLYLVFLRENTEFPM